MKHNIIHIYTYNYFHQDQGMPRTNNDKFIIIAIIIIIVYYYYYYYK